MITFLFIVMVLGMTIVSLRLYFDVQAIKSSRKTMTKSFSISKYEKYWGQIRLLLTAAAGVLISTKVINAQPGDVSSVLDTIWSVATSLEVIVGSLMVAFNMVSSWFAKEKNIVG